MSKIPSETIAVILATVLGLLSLNQSKPVTPIEPDKPAVVDASLQAEVQAAFAGQEKLASAYAGLYAAVADMLESGDFQPGQIQAVVKPSLESMKLSNEKLRPVVSKWLEKFSDVKTWTPELVKEYATRTRELGLACRNVK